MQMTDIDLLKSSKTSGYNYRYSNMQAYCIYVDLSLKYFHMGTASC